MPTSSPTADIVDADVQAVPDKVLNAATLDQSPAAATAPEQVDLPVQAHRDITTTEQSIPVIDARSASRTTDEKHPATEAPAITALEAPALATSPVVNAPQPLPEVKFAPESTQDPRTATDDADTTSTTTSLAAKELRTAEPAVTNPQPAPRHDEAKTVVGVRATGPLPHFDTAPARELAFTMKLASSADSAATADVTSQQPAMEASSSAKTADAPLATPVEIPVDDPHERAASPITEISLSVPGPKQTSASVRLVDRAGELHVAVRASSPEIAASLRTDVEQLTSRLNRAGWSAEFSKPPSDSDSASTDDADPRHKKSQQWPEEME